MLTIEKMLDKAYEKKPIEEIVKAPISALQGISEKTANSIKRSLKAKTIGDFATNKYVLWAQGISLLADEHLVVKDSLDLPSMLDKAWENKPIKEIVDAPVSALQGISERAAEELKKSLKVNTIREFANSKYVRFAQIITYFAETGEDIGSIEQMVDKAWEKKSLKEIADAPVSALQGISDNIAKVLNDELKIKTVRDLATNKYVRWAQALCHMEMLENAGMRLREFLDKEYETKPINEIAAAPISALQGISKTAGAQLEKDMRIKTVRDLGTNKYVKWAQALTLVAELQKMAKQ